MIDKSHRVAGFPGAAGGPIRGAASLAALLLLGGVAAAAEVKFPRENPKVVLDVPDNWTVDMTTTGLEIRSPEKNSIIVAQVVNRKKASVEAWRRVAAEKLKAFGVAFDQGAHVAEKPASPKTATPGTPSASSPSGAASTLSAVGIPAPVALASPGAPADAPKAPDAFTFSGAPSLETPGTVGSNKPVDPGQFSVEALTGFDGKVKRTPKLHFKTVPYAGATKDGKPVDAELAIYTLSDDHVFLLLQESEPTDNRSVAIALSLRGTEDSGK